MENNAKKVPVQFVTHSGKFHADEAMGTAILSAWYNIALEGTFEPKIIRTNDPSPYVDDNISVIYDIGGGCFDHHQKGGNGVRENGIPYASAGLLWVEYGRGVVYSILEKNSPEGMSEEDFSELVNGVKGYVDQFLIQGIDAVDNGAVTTTTDPAVAITSISDMVSNMNQKSMWNVGADADARFLDAVDLCASALLYAIEKAADVLVAQKQVNDAIHGRKYKRVLVLEKYMPWIGTLLSNEEAADIWYCIFPSARNEGHWQMQAVPVASASFEQRHPVPTEWWGATAATMPAITGVADANFCHKSGFLSGAGSFDGAMELARLACADGDPYKEELELYVPASSTTSEYKEV